MSGFSRWLALGMVLAAAGTGWAAGRTLPPQTFELSLNGETFRVEADRRVTLTSRKSPTTQYDVAIRVAPVQQRALNRLSVAYDRGFAATLEPQGASTTLTLAHELGFSVTVSELGASWDEAAQGRYLKQLVEVMRTASGKAALGKVEVSEPEPTDAEHATGQVVTLRFRDRSELDRVCAVYVWNVGRVACSCVVQVADDVAEDAQPLIEAVLDSLAETADK